MRHVPTCTPNFLCMIKLVVGIAYTCLRAIIDLKAIPRLLRLPFVSPRPVAPLSSPSLLPFPRSLGAAIYSYRRHIRSIISKGVSTRLGEPRNRRRWKRRTRMEAKAVSRVEKYFSRRLRARPLRTSPILPFVLFHPFGREGRDTFSTDACAFPDFISLGKIIVALARASFSYVCTRIYARPRSVCVHGFIRMSMRICVCVCVYVCERRKNNGTELASNR